ncbi:selenocysteine lyase SclA [Listeria sp. PSOL-1]|uniref:selenocysteine lyase SclA n=1 Tax=Listeria sp. PSOL-1 TaxID=1844999 RepID=UPI0013D767B9|nr:selenocysteine lyase SclA [Listeria sp. PSOL-1]
MKQVYLNWAATSYQKPPEMIAKVTEELQNNQAFTSDRNLPMFETASLVFKTRLKIAEFFHADKPEQVIFTANITTAINVVLQGLLKDGDHVITTSVEHNAVTRTLSFLKKERGISVTYLPCSKEGELDPTEVERAIQSNTRLMIMTHASNVLGTILDVKASFHIAKKYGVLTMLDSAQTAGFLKIDMKREGIDILGFTGHKSLMALSGIGGFILAQQVADQLTPLITGGTGNQSNLPQQPNELPNKFEAGTENTIGIFSLFHSISAIEKIGLINIQQHENSLFDQFVHGLKPMPVQILGTKLSQKSVPVVSITVQNLEMNELAMQLFRQFGIITRAGLHCAPFAHRTAGTEKTGALRFSFGYYTTKEEVNYALAALEHIFKQRGMA